LSLKDELYNRYIIHENVFESVIAALVNNRGRYNLVDSAILELFEFMTTVSRIVSGRF
jgi:hypothetical protein